MVIRRIFARFLSRRLKAKALAIAALYVCVLHASDALAFCKEVTLQTPANYDPVTRGCFNTDPATDAGLPPLFWRNSLVGYSVQRNASRQVSLNDITAAAAQAFAAWSNASCVDGGHPSVSAVALAPVDCSAVPSEEHNNPIIFRDNGWPYENDSANTLGFTTLTVSKTTGEILGATIEINSSEYQLVAGGASTDGGYDLASVLTHEAGHFLGLAHSSDETAVMYAFYHPGSTALARDDIAGICSIYGADGLRNGSQPKGCDNATPRLGFLSECGSRDAGTPIACDGGGDDGGEGGPSEGSTGVTRDGGEPCPDTLSCGVSPRGPSGAGDLRCVLSFFCLFAACVRRTARFVSILQTRCDLFQFAQPALAAEGGLGDELRAEVAHTPSKLRVPSRRPWLGPAKTTR
jgi:hypothetical protein